MSEKDRIRSHLEDSADAGIAVLRVTHGQMPDIPPFDDAIAAEVIDELFQVGSPSLVAAEIARLRATAGSGASGLVAALNVMTVNLKITS